jgi:hypothetical protein
MSRKWDLGLDGMGRWDIGAGNLPPLHLAAFDQRREKALPPPLNDRLMESDVD